MTYGSDTEKKKYLRDVSKWTRSAERKFKGNIDWLITIQKVDKDNDKSTIEFRAIDKASGLAYGTTPSILVLVGRFARIINDQPDQKTWKLIGTITPKPSVNPERAEAGFFDMPKLIGPFAEFDMDVAVLTISPALAPGGTPTQPTP